MIVHFNVKFKIQQRIKISQEFQYNRTEISPFYITSSRSHKQGTLTPVVFRLLQVLQDGECVNKTQCKACDDEGHREGDAWQKDDCTRCECQGGAVHCTKAACPQDPVCDKGYNMLEVGGHYGDASFHP